eukprot:TRINITY_DN248_c0_g1_i3.p1 TRINITY_DN248_c0_g1~~TRINITY_DN248_c0_g1_i3.p1  ORF type:complete len:236 (-),score=63.09 TRINITY_DN248_c0_g1_i3:332-1039(-)
MMQRAACSNLLVVPKDTVRLAVPSPSGCSSCSWTTYAPCSDAEESMEFGHCASWRSGLSSWTLATTAPSTPTSAGSSSSLPASPAVLSTFYPRDMVVRNTFLDFESDSQPSSPLRRSSSEPLPQRDDAEESRETSIVNVGSGIPGFEVRFDPQIAPPAVGGSELPSLGSAGHDDGICRPCAYFWKDAGCSNGASCTFCHLCGPLEKKRRQKEKKATLKKQAAEAAAQATLQAALQ